MSEYQFYDFLAVDKPLTRTDLEALRSLSTRARISSTSFTNSYEWGSFRGDPDSMMERWFDLHLYLANWGARRLMMRLPADLPGRARLDQLAGSLHCVELRAAGQNLILDISIDEMELDGWEDGTGWLAALAPLRADVLAGDLRLFYLMWLMEVDLGLAEADQMEPMPGIGPISDALEAFADFFGIDCDLVVAAAEREDDAYTSVDASSETAAQVIAGLPDADKSGFLVRLVSGDAHVASELRALVRNSLKSANAVSPVAVRTAGDLCTRAKVIRQEREAEQAEQAAAESRRREEEQLQFFRTRADQLMRHGYNVWDEINSEAERRNASGYDTAANLIRALRSIYEENGSLDEFRLRLQEIRDLHARKERFLERFADLG
ncbi:hypothetical protein [Pannonibacter phragmitetus]|uniref:hypothetical protein n=1 Tax=Pannonibacter phragmitetus TaxID=121719 RepID=UPI000F024470|nr:hypothetical protein [Pannonibacter phragmitetus]